MAGVGFEVVMGGADLLRQYLDAGVIESPFVTHVQFRVGVPA